MVDKDPQDTEILNVVASGGDDDGIDPHKLIAALADWEYTTASVIEALQRAIERGKISLNSEEMVVSLIILLKE